MKKTMLSSRSAYASSSVHHSSSRTLAPARRRNSKNDSYTETSGLRKFFLDQLKDMYWAEKHLLKAIPRMIKATTTDELREAFNTHLLATQTHVNRLEKVFNLLEEKFQARKCDAMEGITREAETIIEETHDDSITRDAALIMAAQKVEHYEIGTYGTLLQLSHTLGEEEVASLIEATLEEEKEADVLLTRLAVTKINTEAMYESVSGKYEYDHEDEE